MHLFHLLQPLSGCRSLEEEPELTDISLSCVSLYRQLSQSTARTTQLPTAQHSTSPQTNTQTDPPEKTFHRRIVNVKRCIQRGHI